MHEWEVILRGIFTQLSEKKGMKEIYALNEELQKMLSMRDIMSSNVENDQAQL